MRYEKLAVTLIDPPRFAHRLAFNPDTMRELMDSIAAIGLINPITVEENNGRYTLLAGHRRLEAHKLLLLPTIDCNVRDAGELIKGEVITWTENLERDDITPVEEARALKHMMETTHLPVEACAKTLRRSETWCRTRLDLLDVPDELLQLVHTGELGLTSALQLARVHDEQHRHYLLRYALDAGASFRVIREWVGQYELTREAGGDLDAVMPPPIVPGQPITITVPCVCCGDAYDAQAMAIVRMCRGCMIELNNAAKQQIQTGTAQPAAEQPPQEAH